jgi:hypothetical protein
MFPEPYKGESRSTSPKTPMSKSRPLLKKRTMQCESLSIELKTRLRQKPTLASLEAPSEQTDLEIGKKEDCCDENTPKTEMTPNEIRSKQNQPGIKRLKWS